MDATGYTTSRLYLDQQQWAEGMLADVKARIAAGVDAKTTLVMGHSARTLHEVADQAKADLIVVGNTGAGATARLLLGSTAHKVVHTGSVPTLVVRAEGAETPKRLFVAVDESQHALRAAKSAVKLASAIGGDVTLVYVSHPNLIPDIPAYHQLLADMERDEAARVEKVFADIKGQLGGSGQANVSTRRLIGGADAFIDHAEHSGADCLVVGSRGRNALARVLVGSFADRVLNVSTRHVLITR